MRKSLVAFALICAVSASSAMAKDVKRINKTMEVENGQKIALNVPVGTLDVQTCNCDEITLRITVEASEGSWSLFSSANVDDAELDIRDRGSRLSFEIDEDNTKQKWKVTVPATSELDIEMGVGNVDISEFDNSLKAEVGVGQISVELKSDNYDDVELESGVGGTSIRGFGRGVRTERAIVSSSATYRGDGEHSINIEVGVGEADISVD